MMRGPEPREQLLRRRLAAPLGGKAGSEHPDPELVVAHAANELSPEYALAITRHLAVCDDGRCTAVLRDATAGAAVARDALYFGGPRRDEHTDSALGAPHRQSERAFECDDALWEAFEAIAVEEGSSTDWLLNEAMKAYAQQRSGPVAPREVTFKDAPHDPFPGGASAPSPPARERNTPTLPRAYVPRAPSSQRGSWRASANPLPAVSSATLCVILEGVRHEVTKERFVVGRGGWSSDLAIDDPEVSRQHAVIERAGTSYYLVDMGSTNGVEYHGEKIARKEIAHGDRFRLGDHELEFLFG